MTTKAPRAQSTRASDIVGLSFAALWQQKVRTILTITGVVIGTFALVVSLAVGRGVDHAILSLFHEDSRLRKISVNERYDMASEDVPASEREPKGAMSEAKRKRISKALVRLWGRTHMRTERRLLNAEAIENLSRIEHVERIEPVVWMNGDAIYNGKREESQVASITAGSTLLRTRLLAGRLFTNDDAEAAMVDEFLLYRMGLASDDAASQVLGRTIRFDYSVSQNQQLDLVGIMTGGSSPTSEKESKTLTAALKRLSFLVRLLPMPSDERAALKKVFERLTTTTTTKNVTYGQDFTIVGVFREIEDDDEKPGPFGNWMSQNASILLPTEPAVALFCGA